MRSRTIGFAAALVLPVVVSEAAAQTATQTQSNGVIYGYDYVSDGRRNDTYETQITGFLPDGSVEFAQTHNWAFEDSITQAALAAAMAPRAYANDGAPSILIWSDPVLVDSYEEFLDSFTEITYTTESGGTIVTTQITSGDAANPIVYVGDRGSCYDAGANGPTNTPPNTGAFANCDFGEEYEVSAGEVNTNTHTTDVINTVERSFTNEDYRNYATYELTAEVVPIGASLAGVQTGAFDSTQSFLDRLGQQGPTSAQFDFFGASPFSEPLIFRNAGRQFPLRLWGGAYGEWARADDGVVNMRRDAVGVAGGVLFSPEPNWRFGAAFDHGTADTESRDAPEEAQTTLTHLATHAAYLNGAWFSSGAAAFGFGEAETERGDASVGGVSTAAFDVSTAGVSALLGYRFSAGETGLPVLGGVDWTQLSTEGFTESGGIPLTAGDETSERSHGWIGVGLERSWGEDEASSFDLRARLRWVSVLSGGDPAFPVAFAAAPTAQLEIPGLTESDFAELSVAALVRMGGVALRLTADASGNDDEEAYRVGAGLYARW